MEIVSSMLFTYQKAMGMQKYNATKEYRWIHYYIKTFVEDGILFLNLLTKELIFVKLKEKDVLENNDFWVAHWFMIPKNMDERRLSMQFKELLMLMHGQENKMQYTILTTMNCNARCSYCYEDRKEKSHMTLGCADKVADYIVGNSRKEKVKLTWFGGEPLFNTVVIDRICERLRDKGIDFQSFIVSNGYLFDSQTIEKAKKQWFLSRVQITLDGTEERYNAIKAYIYRDTNPFLVVLHNIGELLSAGMFVQIRLNMGTENFEDLYSLCDILKEKFGQYPNVVVYPAILHEDCSRPEFSYSDQIKADLRKMYFKLQDYIDELGIGAKDTIAHGYKIQSCAAENDNAITISPDGNLTECQHFTDTQIVGTVDDGITNSELAEAWKEHCPEQEGCCECKFYVDCIKLEKCPIRHTCSDHDRSLMDYKIRRSILNTYDIYRKNCKK